MLNYITDLLNIKRVPNRVWILFCYQECWFWSRVLEKIAKTVKRADWTGIKIKNRAVGVAQVVGLLSSKSLSSALELPKKKKEKMKKVKNRDVCLKAVLGLGEKSWGPELRTRKREKAIE
jgi:hypothetical protein